MTASLTLNKITAQKGITIGEAANRVADLGLDAELRSGGDDLPDRLQDLEASARSDETGAAFLLSHAGRKGQSRLRRA